MVTIEPALEECENDQRSAATNTTGGPSASQPEGLRCEQVSSNGESKGDKLKSVLCDAKARGKEEQHRSHPEADDWETASEGDEDGSEGDPNVLKSGNVNENYEDALTEDEQNQRMLSQADAAKSQGNALYASGNYDEALKCYGNALEITADHANSNDIRAMCYSNSAMCHLQLKQYEEAVELSTKALELNPTYAKAFLRRAQALEKLDRLDEALTDLNKVVELNPGNQQASSDIKRLEPVVAERREKMKEEMIGKLKDLGNSVLGRFGMSVDNFKAVKDPNTGSYSISFQR